MKYIKKIQMLLVACVLPAIGCAQAQLSPEVARSMVQVRRDLSNTKAQLERTSATLRDIEKNPRLNTEQQIGFFREEMVKLEQAIQQVRDVRMDMETKSEEYFEAWGAEMGKMEDQQLAAAAKARRDASMQAVKAVQAKLEEVSTTGSPLMSGLRDLDRYFEHDETAEGAQAAVPTIQRTLGLKDPVIWKIDEAIAQIDQVTQSVE
ncbi:MAG: hypothetical protein JSU68_15165 [Phycisphaerales bacterium]|nr:MAG: hypothetical protein JSU68_15165 [Phycisphaerales bacterium]